MWCKYVSLCIWCSAKVLFTFTLVLGCQWARKGLSVNMSRWNKQQDVGWARVNKNIVEEREQTSVQSNSGSRPWRTHSWRTARRLPFKYVQSHSCNFPYRREPPWIFNILLACYDYLVTYYLRATMISCIPKLSMILTVVYFHRLKINHDSHEFILESGTVTNKYWC